MTDRQVFLALAVALLAMADVNMRDDRYRIGLAEAGLAIVFAIAAFIVP